MHGGNLLPTPGCDVLVHQWCTSIPSMETSNTHSRLWSFFVTLSTKYFFFCFDCFILTHCVLFWQGHSGLPGTDGTPGVKGDQVKWKPWILIVYYNHHFNSKICNFKNPSLWTKLCWIDSVHAYPTYFTFVVQSNLMFFQSKLSKLSTFPFTNYLFTFPERVVTYMRHRFPILHLEYILTWDTFHLD